MRHKVAQTDFQILFHNNLQEKSFKMMFFSWQYLRYQGSYGKLKVTRSSDTKIQDIGLNGV